MTIGNQRYDGRTEASKTSTSRGDRGTLQPRPSACLKVRMVTRYRLFHPVVGFIESENQVVTMPVGAIVNMASRGPSVGLCLIAWQGKLIESFREDVERHGAVLKQPLIQ
jgi:hypothetical protein